MGHLSFGQALTLYRQRQGRSQPQLGKRARMHPSYISRLELGQRLPSLEAVEKLVQGLELNRQDADTLRMAAGYMPESAEAVYHYPELVQLDRVLDRATRTHLVGALATVEALAQYLERATR